MSTRVVDQVDDWTEESFSGGYRELHALADRDFSGVVRAGGAELYMTRGVVVGVRMGDIEDFEDASGTLYEAPAEALPLLAIMQEQDVDVRAKYYSEKTSISKVDGTLSDGGFTGYIELSENVLSGDYYLVYHAGQSMSVAYVGESGKLLQGDEAFETADDEVGIFKVRQVDIEPVEIPEPEEPVGSPAGDTTPEMGGDSGQERTSQSSEQDVDSNPAEQSGESLADDAAAVPTEEADSATTTETGTAAQATEDAGTATTAESSGSSSQTAENPGTESVTPDDGSGTTSVEATSETAPTDRSEDKSETATTDRTETAATPSPETTERNAGSGSAQSTERSEPMSNEPTQRSEQADRERTTPGTARQTESEASTERGQSADPTPRERQSGAAGQPTETERRSGGGQRTDEPQRSQESPPSQSRSGQSSRSQPQGRQTATQRRSSAGGASADLETKSIPSIDPSHTSVPDDTAIESPTPQSGSVDQPAAPNQQRDSRDRQTQTTTPPQEPVDQSPPQQTQPSPPAADTEDKEQSPPEQSEAPSVDSERLSELESELDEKEETIDQLESELETATEKRDELQSELDAVEAERDELASEVERLETELERLEDELGAATNAERRLTADEALAGTDIFVRYRSKGKATLKKAHGGSTRKDEVNENLRLEKHTQFDADSVAVGGQSYEEFLENTLEFQFVRWAVRELLFEIRDTGHEKELRNLYDVLPLIDRAELSGVVDVTYTEDGQETQSQESFDVVLRDRMGHPLLAANLNDSRDATTEAMMERLITSAERVGQGNDDFSAAFLVTESFFDPGALEVTSQATQGGLLSRDKRKSFVNLSRKQGYHLCLVEARSENFHLAVPEL